MVVRDKYKLSHTVDVSRRPLFIGFSEVGQKSFGPPKGGYPYKIPKKLCNFFQFLVILAPNFYGLIQLKLFLSRFGLNVINEFFMINYFLGLLNWIQPVFLLPLGVLFPRPFHIIPFRKLVWIGMLLFSLSLIYLLFVTLFSDIVSYILSITFFHYINERSRFFF